MVDAISAPRPKRYVEEYESHLQAREAYKSGPRRVKGKPAPVTRRVDVAGYRLPTRDEIDHARRIAGYIRFSLPDNFDDHLWFIRSFLDVFAYGPGRKDTPKHEVKRRCSTARQSGFYGGPFIDLAYKLEMPPEQAEILLEYGLQRVPNHWRHDPDESPDDCLLSPDPDEEGAPPRIERDWFESDEDEPNPDAAI